MAEDKNDELKLPSDMQFFSHPFYGGPMDGHKRPSTNYAPAPGVTVVSVLEDGLTILGSLEAPFTPEMLEQFGDECLDCEQHIYVMLKEVNPQTGKAHEFYAYAGQDKENYLDHIVVGGPDFNAANQVS